MRRPSELTLVFVVTALAIASHYMATPLVPLAAAHTGADTAGVGLATGIFALLPLLLAVPVGLLGDRRGQARVAVAGAALMTATTAALAVPSLAALVGAQALRGLGQMALMIGMQGFISATVAMGPRRQTAYSSFVLAVSIGQLAGPALAGWVAGRSGLSAAFLAAAALALAATALGAPVAWRPTPSVGPAAEGAAQRAGGSDGERSADLRGAFALMWDRPTRGAVSASAFILLEMTMGTAFYPLFLQHAGYPATVIGLLIALRGVGACMGRPILPAVIRLANDRWRLLRIVFWTICAATAATPLTPALWYQALISILTGTLAGIAQPITMSVVADRSGENRRSEGVALRVGTNRLLQFVGPLGLGLVGEYTGLDGIFVVGGLLPLIGLLMLRGLGGRRAVTAPGRA